MKALLVLLLASVCGLGQAPPEVQALNNLPNAAELWLTYCSAGNRSCVNRKAICYGQCGDQTNADDSGYACSGDIEGKVPRGYHYASWFSVDLETHKRIRHGLATKGYNTTGCHNPR